MDDLIGGPDCSRRMCVGPCHLIGPPVFLDNAQALHNETRSGKVRKMSKLIVNEAYNLINMFLGLEVPFKCN